MSNPISDMLTRIRNAQMARHNEVVVPFSGLKMAIAEILRKENFIKEFGKIEENGKENIRIFLNYGKNTGGGKIPAISGLREISRSGQRIYVKKNEIRKVKNNFGIAIISTSKGVMTGAEAKKLGLGGEYICEVW